MVSQWWTDDDTLLAVLRDAMDAERDVPRQVIEAGKSAWAWRTIDAELAALTYDSAAEADLLTAGTRAEPAALRALTFTRDEMTIELEVTEEALVGQITPARAGESVVVRARAGEAGSATTDELGFFTIRPVPDQPFRLLIRTVAGTAVLTGWVSP